MDNKTDYVRTWQVARSLQSERDRAVQELRRLTSPKKGVNLMSKRPGNKADRRRDREPEEAKVQRRELWEHHEDWRQVLLGSRSVLLKNALDLALVLHATLPSGVPAL